MTFVLDASMAATWMLPDEATPSANDILTRLETEEALSPTLLWFELRHVLINAERRGRLGAGETVSLMQTISAMPIVDAGRGNDHSILRLAGKHGISAYDASYLALALAERVMLATLDKRLAAAAHAEAIDVIGPLARPT